MFPRCVRASVAVYRLIGAVIVMGIPSPERPGKVDCREIA